MSAAAAAPLTFREALTLVRWGELPQFPQQVCAAFFRAALGALDGSLDAAAYETECADLMGTGAYMLFTLERLVQSAAKQLVHVAHEPAAQRCVAAWQGAHAQPPHNQLRVQCR